MSIVNSKLELLSASNRSHYPSRSARSVAKSARDCGVEPLSDNGSTGSASIADVQIGVDSDGGGDSSIARQISAQLCHCRATVGSIGNVGHASRAPRAICDARITAISVLAGYE